MLSSARRMLSTTARSLSATGARVHGSLSLAVSLFSLEFSSVHSLSATPVAGREGLVLLEMKHKPVNALSLEFITELTAAVQSLEAS